MDFSNGIAAPANWRNSSIGEVCTIFTSGGTPSRKRADFYSDGDIPWVKTQELQDRVIISSDEHITKDGLANSSAKLLPQETVLMAMYGATVGRLGILGIEATCNQASAAMCVDQELAEYRFLFYLLKTHRERIIEQASGGAQQNLSGKQIKDFRFNFPPVSEQEAIAEILWSLDQLIWKNEETAATLESIAQTLFRSWFVDFDPVRAKMAGEKPVGMDDATAALFPDSMEHSELGDIPAGWTIMSVGDFTRRLPTGPRYDSKSVAPEGEVPVLDQGARGIIGFHDDAPGVSASSTDPVVTFANHTCVLRLITFPFSTIQNVIPLVGEGVDSIWMYHALRGKQEFESYKGHFPDLLLKTQVIPPSALTEEFQSICQPIIGHQRLLEKANNSLSEIRDSLLPRLISGELQVPESLVA